MDALILGGTSGLGLELALQSAEKGINPIIYGRSVYEKMSLFPTSARLFRVDLAKPAKIKVINLEDADIKYFFWVAGIFKRKSLKDTKRSEIFQLTNVHATGATEFLRQFHKIAVKKGKPYHLIVVASTSAYKLRENETLYCGLKAYQAAFARNFASELSRDLPGSKVTLVNPGGMKSDNFYRDTKQDISNFMEPKWVAKVIWAKIEWQQKGFHEFNIIRTPSGPMILDHAMVPETPIV